MDQYSSVKAGNCIPECQITDHMWNSQTKSAILALRERSYYPTDPILKCVQDMIKHDLHMKAMFEICEKYGTAARTVVTFVLNRYTEKVDSHCDNIDDLDLDDVDVIGCVDENDGSNPQGCPQGHCVNTE